jgi:hypothetical protein
VGNVGKLSATKISTFEQCHKYFHFQYVLYADRSFTPIEWELGSMVHDIAAKLFLQIRDRHRGVVPKLGNAQWFAPLLEQSTKGLAEQVKNGEVRIVREGQELDYYLKQAQDALATLTGRVLPALAEQKVLGVESDLGDFAIGGAPFAGRLDLVTQSGGNIYVHDWKTGKRREEDKRQAQIYYFASKHKYRGPATRVSLYHLLEAGEVAEHYVFRDEELNALQQEVKRIAEQIAALTAYGARTSALCHWCPYGPQCEEGTAWMEANTVPGQMAELDLGI